MAHIADMEACYDALMPKPERFARGERMSEEAGVEPASPAAAIMSRRESRPGAAEGGRKKQDAQGCQFPPRSHLVDGSTSPTLSLKSSHQISSLKYLN